MSHPPYMPFLFKTPSGNIHYLPPPTESTYASGSPFLYYDGSEYHTHGVGYPWDLVKEGNDYLTHSTGSTYNEYNDSYVNKQDYFIRLDEINADFQELRKNHNIDMRHLSHQLFSIISQLLKRIEYLESSIDSRKTDLTYKMTGKPGTQQMYDKLFLLKTLRELL